MPKIDPYEKEVLSAYETGELTSIAPKSELARIRAAARATGTKDKPATFLICFMFTTINC